MSLLHARTEHSRPSTICAPPLHCRPASNWCAQCATLAHGVLTRSLAFICIADTVCARTGVSRQLPARRRGTRQNSALRPRSKRAAAAVSAAVQQALYASTLHRLLHSTSLSAQDFAVVYPRQARLRRGRQCPWSPRSCCWSRRLLDTSSGLCPAEWRSRQPLSRSGCRERARSHRRVVRRHYSTRVCPATRLGVRKARDV